MRITEYKIKNKNFGRRWVFALVSDLHGESPDKIIKLLREIRPDVILAPGDILEPLDLYPTPKANENGFALLEVCAEIAPTYYSLGNHELGGLRSWSMKWKFTPGKERALLGENLARIDATGAILLDDNVIETEDFAIGGLSSGLTNIGMIPDLSVIDRLCGFDKPKILLSHHPEYYPKYLKDKNIDLIVSGHAHGGQWRIFGRGVFAPGQGIFPKYTSGVHDNKFVIGKGMKTTKKIPRIFNPTEVVKIVIE